MASSLRGVARVQPNSKTLEEARSRTFDFFKKACRSLPTVMDIYNLHDVVTVSQLRSSIAAQIRKNINVTNPKVIDMLVFKGIEELTNIVDHAKQRHHVIGQYVLGPEGLDKDLGMQDQGSSHFLKRFYETNYF
ncbi:NADH dehydrogenase [ubiquinone] 1 alpha subcomplex subunit 6 [Platanthera zijinensis]|uniref:NADH dehydrogenase [ubiquinone] 1 alpha subcomplex subunit 6 n=1 Tax=Platanthera zijinensis TaxID=2320716 RepID=A0AAP0C643_9ASPA